MSKSFVFLTIALGLVLAHVCSAGPTKYALSTRGVDFEESDESDNSADDDDSDSESESEYESDGNEENPAPSCLLFGDKACHMECSIMAEVYKTEAEGNCDDNKTCQCHISSELSFHKMWKEKFDSKYVYHQVNNNDLVLEQAHRIFNYPLRTAEEFKKLFRPIISPYQFSTLKTHDDSLAAKFTKNGEYNVDEKAAQEHVVKKVDELLKSKNNKSLLNTKYKLKFKQALEKSEGDNATVYNLAFRVGQLKNKQLEEILDEYLKKNKLTKPKVEVSEKEDLTEILTNAVINEIIKRNEENNKSAEKSAVATGKKGGAKGKKTKVTKKDADTKKPDETKKKSSAVTRPKTTKKHTTSS